MTLLPSFRSLMSGAALLLAATLLSQPVQAQDQTRSVEEIESIVRDYLLANPQVIMDALRALERQEQVAAEAARSQAMSALVPTLAASPLTPVFGDEGSDVTLIEFFDYQCGFCKRMFPGMQNVMESDENLRVIFVELPILSPASLTAARAALASQEQGKYLDYHTALMTFQGRLTDEIVFQKAEEVGLDVDELRGDMAKPEIDEYLGLTQAMAEALQIRGTPAMVIGDQFIGGFIQEEQLRGTIAQIRSDAS